MTLVVKLMGIGFLFLIAFRSGLPKPTDVQEFEHKGFFILKDKQNVRQFYKRLYTK
jgi:hypothetical protein